MKERAPRAVIADLPPGVSVHRLGNGYFRVRLGKKFTEGRPQVKDFKTVGGCRSWIESQLRDRSALRSMQLTPEQIAQAKAAFQRLDDVSLETVIDFYFNSGPGHREPKKIQDVVEEYKRHHQKSGNKTSYIKAQMTSIGVLSATAGKRTLAGYTDIFLNEWFNKMRKEREWGTINTLNYFRDLKMFFHYCLRSDLITRNPLDSPKFDWIRKLRKQAKRKHHEKVTVFTADESYKLLTVALNHPEIDLLAWLVLAIFSGVRIDELTKLTWECIRWDDRQISLTWNIVAKGGSPRHIDFNEAFASWLECVPAAKEKTGPILSQVGFRRRRDTLHELSGVPKKRNGLRHTFASHHYVHHKDAAETRRAMGHEKLSDVLFANYVSLVKRKDAEQFWALRPPKVRVDYFL